MVAIGVTVHISQRVANSKLSDTIQSLFSQRLDHLESDNVLRDEWITEVEKLANVTSGKAQVLESKIANVERTCDRRHDPRQEVSLGRLTEGRL
jgi:hypothetical protein